MRDELVMPLQFAGVGIQRDDRAVAVHRALGEHHPAAAGVDHPLHHDGHREPILGQPSTTSVGDGIDCLHLLHNSFLGKFL